MTDGRGGRKLVNQVSEYDDNVGLKLYHKLEQLVIRYGNNFSGNEKTIIKFPNAFLLGYSSRETAEKAVKIWEHYP